jgi:hypothetical protein
VAGDRARIEGNTVGLDKNGNAEHGFTQEFGIAVDGSAEDTTIGGDSPGAGNTISGNVLGIELRDGSSGTVVEGNLIGTDADGRDALPNEIGVFIGDEELGGESVEARIGGARSAQRNVISGNAEVGVSAPRTKADVVIEGNYIGSAPTARLRSATAQDSFLAVTAWSPRRPLRTTDSSPAEPRQGRATAPHNNGDDFDFGDGVQVGHTSGGVMILGNEIFANDSGGANDPGIDLLGNGVSANGSEDPDVVPPFPVLTSVDAVAAGTLVGGTIDYPAGRDVRIEFFSNPNCDASGHGEGQTPLGALTLTGSVAPAAFSARVAAAPAAHAITATATDPRPPQDLRILPLRVPDGRAPVRGRPAAGTRAGRSAGAGAGRWARASAGDSGDRRSAQAAVQGAERGRAHAGEGQAVPHARGGAASARRRGRSAAPASASGWCQAHEHRQGATRPPGAAIGLTLERKRIKTRRR